MKIYSIFLVVLMMVNFGLMFYKRVGKRIVIVLSIFSYGAFVFVEDLSLSSQNPFLLYILALMILTLFLYKSCGRQIFKIVYFVLPWIILSRLLGLPDNPNFGEKNFGILVTSAFNATFCFGLISCFFIKKSIKRLFFG